MHTVQNEKTSQQLQQHLQHFLGSVFTVSTSTAFWFCVAFYGLPSGPVAPFWVGFPVGSAGIKNNAGFFYGNYGIFENLSEDVKFKFSDIRKQPMG